MPKNIILKYGNINISQYLNVKLGNLFPKKKYIKINIINNPKIFPNIIKPIYENIQNYNLFQNKNIEINNSNQFSNKYNKLKLPPIQKNIMHNFSFNNIITPNNILNNKSKSNHKNNNIFGSKIKLKTLNKIKIKTKLFSENNKISHNLENKTNQ